MLTPVFDPFWYTKGVKTAISVDVSPYVPTMHTHETPFGTQRSLVQIQSPRLNITPAESSTYDTCRWSAERPV